MRYKPYTDTKLITAADKADVSTYVTKRLHSHARPVTSNIPLKKDDIKTRGKSTC